MTPTPYVNPPDRNWELRPLVIIASDDAAAAAVGAQMTGTKQTHFGLFKGWLGHLGGSAAAIAVAEGAEGPTYAALRQMCFLYRPKIALYLGSATAAVEGLRPGDVAWVSEARRCFHPVAVADNMFTDDSALFNSPELKSQIQNARPIAVDSQILEALMPAVASSDFPEALQSTFPDIVVGSSDRQPAQFRGLELARSRFGVDVLDQGGYGFLSALKDEGLAGAALLQIRAGCSGEYPAEFDRHASRFHSLLGKVAERSAGTLLNLAEVPS